MEEKLKNTCWCLFFLPWKQQNYLQNFCILCTLILSPSWDHKHRQLMKTKNNKTTYVMWSSKMSLSWPQSNFRVIVYLVKQPESFVLPKSHNNWTSGSDRQSEAESNTIQNKFHTIIGCIYKSIILAYNSFCLITSHMLFWYFLSPLTHQDSYDLWHNTLLYCYHNGTDRVVLEQFCSYPQQKSCTASPG